MKKGEKEEKGKMDRRIGREDLENTEIIWRFPLNEQKKEENLKTIRQAVLHKRIRKFPSFWEIVWCQMHFQSWRHWIVQGGVLLTAFLFTYMLQKRKFGENDSLAACSVFLVFAGNFCLNGVARLFSRNMAELEQTLYLNLKQMVCIRMVEAGLVDLGILALFVGTMGRGLESGFWGSLFYMSVPFLWSAVLYLHMLRISRSRFSVFWQFAVGMLCGVMSFFPACIAQAYEPKYMQIWQSLCIIGVLLLVVEVSGIFGNIERGDNLCLS